jgi:hypothetical protein
LSTYEQFVGLKPRGSAAGATDLGIPPMAVRKDTGADLAGADGDYAPPQMDATGNLRVNVAASPVLGEVQASPTANTVLDRLKTIATTLSTIDGHVDGLEGLATTLNALVDGLEGLAAAATPAGSNEIGRTNIKHFNIVATGSGILTRPANTTAYAANDSVSDNATAGSVTPLPVTVSDTNDDPVDITEILLDSTDTGFGGVPVRVHLFNSDPTASSGVGAGDNVAWSQKKAGWVGSFSGTMIAFSDGSRGVLTPDGPAVKLASVESGGKKLWWQLQTLGAATPSASSTVFTPRFKGYQGRA